MATRQILSLIAGPDVHHVAGAHRHGRRRRSRPPAGAGLGRCRRPRPVSDLAGGQVDADRRPGRCRTGRRTSAAGLAAPVRRCHASYSSPEPAPGPRRAASVRSTDAPARASDVAVGDRELVGRVVTFTPTPTTAAGPAGVSTRSTRIPATFRSSTSTSLGHLSVGGDPGLRGRPRRRATPGQQRQPRPAPRRSRRGRSSTEKVSAARAGSPRLRSSRPRPAVWCSATTTSPSARARPRPARPTSALVERGLARRPRRRIRPSPPQGGGIEGWARCGARSHGH